MVQRLVDKGAQLMKPKKDGMNILHISSACGDVRILDYALKLREGTTSIDSMTEEGFSPAHVACLRSYFDALNLLIEHGADLTKRNGHESTCFDELLKTDNLELFECIYPRYGHLQKRQKREPGHFPMLHLAAGA
jgi:ankyrin repeat protein